VSKVFPLVDGGNAWRIAFGTGGEVPTFAALTEVSFEVPKGQFVGVLGRNGAGKSTLLRVIGGVYSADRGKVSVNGSLSALYELGLVGNRLLTGREYADRLLTVHGFGSRERASMIEDIHEFSELGDRLGDPIGTYSTGMTARLFFATATTGHYDVYLLDEILSVGDAHFQGKCWRRLRDRISRGASGVLVTHDWSAILRLCETAHIIDQGRIKFSGPASRAVRIYLYGEAERAPYLAGIARFTRRPQTPIRARPAEDLSLGFEATIDRPAKVSATCVVERLQPGFGWETVLMSRSPQPVGEEPGRYQIDVSIGHLPLEAGSYQFGAHLITGDPDNPGRRVALDGFSWLNGDGLELQVEDDASAPGLALPLTWSVRQA
jgi:lipopolysaccharide transport system ATP-binding protein